MYRTNRNIAVIRLLLQLKAYESDYPDNLFSMRRSYFVRLIYRILSMIW
ncbi:MAG: hypothetical protein OHK0041_23150 [Anaerolineales bacterium]